MKTIKANEVTYIKRLETDKQDRDSIIAAYNKNGS